MRYVIVHGGCRDGFTAAWVAWLHMQTGETPGAEIFFEGIQGDKSWGNTKRLLSGELPAGEVIYFDCCPPRDLLVALADKMPVQVYDHHISNKLKCDDLEYCHFDLEKSGAGLAWQFYTKGAPEPHLIKYVQDYDLWTFKYPETKAVSAYMEGFKFGFSDWSWLWDQLEYEPTRKSIIETGEQLLKQTDAYVQRCLSSQHWIQLGGHHLPAVNSLIFQSEIGDQLAKTHPAAVVYYRKQEVWRFSLRSCRENPEALDVSVLAGKYGGGGHANAAGFAVKSLDALDFLLPE